MTACPACTCADASVRRVSVMTAQAPCLPTIVPESNDVSTRLLSVPAAHCAAKECLK